MPAHFFDRHHVLARAVLVLLIPAIPVVALWNYVPDVIADWRDDWRHYGSSHD